MATAYNFDSNNDHPELECWPILSRLTKTDNTIRFAHVFLWGPEAAQKALVQCTDGCVYLYSEKDHSCVICPELSTCKLSYVSVGEAFIIVVTESGHCFSFVSGSSGCSWLSIWGFPFIQIRSGYYHTLALGKDGSVVRFDNRSRVNPYDIGYNRFFETTHVIQGITKVWAGGRGSGFLTKEGEVKVWGVANKLDNDDPFYSKTILYEDKTTVDLAQPLVDMCIGSAFILFLLEDHTVWGSGYLRYLSLRSRWPICLRLPPVQSLFVSSVDDRDTVFLQTTEGEMMGCGEEVRVNRKDKTRAVTGPAKLDCSDCLTPCVSINKALANHGGSKVSMMKPVIVDNKEKVGGKAPEAKSSQKQSDGILRGDRVQNSAVVKGNQIKRGSEQPQNVEERLYTGKRQETSTKVAGAEVAQKTQEIKQKSVGKVQKGQKTGSHARISQKEPGNLRQNGVEVTESLNLQEMLKEVIGQLGDMKETIETTTNNVVQRFERIEEGVKELRNEIRMEKGQKVKGRQLRAGNVD